MTTYKNLLILLVITLIPNCFYGQTANKNYVLSQQARKEGLSPNDFNDLGLSTLEITKQVGYFDGLGRPVQKIQVGLSPKERDIITPIMYDATGRITKQYLPFTKANGGSFDAEAIDSQEFFYLTEAKIANTNFAYSEAEYDNSPLNKVKEISAPGFAWSMDQGQTQTIDYKLNDGNSEVLFFTYDYTTGNCTNIGFHPTGTLKMLEHSDEDDNKTTSYSDAWNKVITNGKFDNTTASEVRTYYIYDDFGQLRYVIPPEGLKQLKAANGNYCFSRSDLVCDQLFFWYKYDEKHRIIEKKEPGKDVIYIVYDELDRPVLTQDGLQRPSNSWSFIKYDKHSRPIQTGIHIASGSLAALQGNVNVFYSTSSASNYEEIISNQSQVAYTNISYPTTTAQTTVYKEIYYDNYDFDVTSSFPFVQEGSINTNTNRVKGYMTGSKTRIINSSPVEWLYTVYYFDEYGRTIQTITQNHLEGWDRFSSLIKFDGLQTNSIHTHVVFEGDPVKEKTTIQYRDYSYDHAGRLLAVDHTVDNATPVRMVSNSYNELGQLVEKNLHDMQEEGCLQSIDYKYNIRGWLNRINSANLDNNNNLIDLEEVVASTEQVDGMRLDTILFKVASYRNGVVSSLMIEVEDSKSLKISKIDDPTDIRYYSVGESSSFEIYDNVIDIDEFDALHAQLGQQFTLNMDQLMFSESFDRQTMLVFVMDKVRAQLEALLIKDELLITAITRQASNYFAERIDIVYFNEDNNDLFGMDLYYNEGLSELDGEKRWDGKITGMRWQTTVNSGIRAYGFKYDDLDRIKQAKYGEYSNYSWDKENKFGLNINKYDLNGNIEELQRYGVVGTDAGKDVYGLMDNLEYTYNGNQLDELNDFVTNLTFASNDFRDNGSNASGEYDYDANGNLIKDDNKGITNIEYNHINQPELVEFGTTKKIEYLYTSDGAKLQMKIIDGTNITTLDYSSGFVYTNEQVDYVLTEEGRLTPSTSGNPFVYEYFIKDHLGNVRVSFSDYNGDGIGEILQENHYYPFGLTFGGLNYVSPISAENLLQYNGKENQEGHNLAWVDYGFRMYDPQIGRWHVIDALAQNYNSTSPYAYVRNNPINRIDVMGLAENLPDEPGSGPPYGRNDFGRNIYGKGNNETHDHWTDAVNYSTEGDYQMWNNAYYGGYTRLSYSKWSAIYRNATKYGSGYKYGQIGGHLTDSGQEGKVYGLYKRDGSQAIVISWESVGYAAVETFVGLGIWMALDDMPDSYFGEVDQTGGGGLASDGITLQEAGTAVGAFGAANGVKTNLVEWGMKGADWGKAGAKYLKYVKRAGTIGFVANVGISGYGSYDYYYNQNGTGWQVGAKSTLDVAMGAAAFVWPIGTAISGAYFILDVSTGGFGGWGNPYKP